MFANPGLDHCRRLHRHNGARGAARIHTRVEVRLDADILAERRREHRISLGDHVGTKHPIDIGEFQTRIRDRAPRRLRMQRHRRRARHLADLGVKDTGYNRLFRHERSSRLRTRIKLDRRQSTAITCGLFFSENNPMRRIPIPHFRVSARPICKNMNSRRMHIIFSTFCR